MASPLKHLAKQSLAGAKRRVRLHPMSADEATAVVFTVMTASPAPLLRAATNSKAGKNLPSGLDPRVFEHGILSVLNVRKGSVYAAIVTAIDQNNIFHSDRFAVSLKRLGVMDDIEMKLSADGFEAIASLVANKAPFWWADMSAIELDTVRGEMSGSLRRIIRRHSESLSTDDLNVLIENQLAGLPMNTLPGKLQFLYGASQTLLGTNQSQYRQLAQRVVMSPQLVTLSESSSLSATFESFYQHLLTNVLAFQRLMPRASFGGKTLTPTQLQRIFRDPQVARRLKRSFEGAYQRSSHSVALNSLYQTMKRNNVATEIFRAGKTNAKVTLTDEAISAITSSVIGLFSAFAGDSKGQAFPMMSSFKKG